MKRPVGIAEAAFWLYPDSVHRFDERRDEFRPYGFTCEVWEAVTMSRPDRHDEIEINFIDQGTLTYLLGGHRLKIEPQTFTVFWAAVPHQIVDSSDVTFYYVVTIPFGGFLRWGLPSEMLNALVTGHVLTEKNDGRVLDDGLVFRQWSRDLDNPDTTPPGIDEIVQLELKARMLRLARSVAAGASAAATNPRESNERPANLQKAELMAAFIARNYASKIQIRDIAASVGLHPDYAATLFRKTFGTTLNSLLTTHRIADAQRQLLTAGDRIVDIAYGAGFDSLSRFNRAFKEVTGMTPREYRKGHGSVPAIQTGDATPDAGPASEAPGADVQGSSAQPLDPDDTGGRDPKDAGRSRSRL
jgi:AraC family transcriptional regulator, melibiose operon regulatory protein